MIKLDLNQCSERVLKAYAEDAKNPENIRQLLKEKEEVVYVELAGNLHADKETLRYLYERYARTDTSTFCAIVFRSLFSNPSTPTDLLIKLASKIYSKDAATEFLRNPSIPKEAIDILFKQYGKSLEIAEKMICHENTSAQTLINIATEHEQLAHEVLATGKVKLVES